MTLDMTAALGALPAHELPPFALDSMVDKNLSEKIDNHGSERVNQAPVIFFGVQYQGVDAASTAVSLLTLSEK
jgi:hypothetical protein